MTLPAFTVAVAEAPGIRDRQPKPLVEHRPVGESRERVVVGQVHQPFDGQELLAPLRAVAAALPWVHRPAVAALARRLPGILWHTLAPIVHRAETILCLGVPLLRCQPIPFRCGPIVLIYAATSAGILRLHTNDPYATSSAAADGVDGDPEAAQLAGEDLFQPLAGGGEICF